jgi:outer membrane protein OmpA-like peptidoglycan-associated protein
MVLSLTILFLLLTSCSSKKNTQSYKTTSIASISAISKKEAIQRQEYMFLQNIYFDFDSYKITNIQDKANLQLVKRYLMQNQDKNILLTGYCDEKGSDSYNNDLGLKRANEVKQTLIDLGINQDRIQVKSFGRVIGNKNIGNNKTEYNEEEKEYNQEEQKLNRKVVINIMEEENEK